MFIPYLSLVLFPCDKWIRGRLHLQLYHRMSAEDTEILGTSKNMGAVQLQHTLGSDCRRHGELDIVLYQSFVHTNCILLSSCKTFPASSKL